MALNDRINHSEVYEEDKYEEDSDANSYDDCEYKITANMCSRLSREFGIEENNITMNIEMDYDIPPENGLHNCNMIIPSYYELHKHPSKIFTVDYLEIIKDDIRNFRPLNIYQLDYINELSHEDKNEIIRIFNEITKTFSTVINE